MTKLQINLQYDDIVEITDVQMPIKDKMYVITVATESKYLSDLSFGSSGSPDFCGPMVMFFDDDKTQLMALSLDGYWTVKYVPLKYEYKIIFIKDSLVYDGESLDEKDVDIIEWKSK